MTRRRIPLKWVEDPVTGCWEVTSHAPGDSGVPIVYHEGRRWKAHHWEWMKLHGPVPAGVELRRTCMNPLCINPEHLYLHAPGDWKNVKPRFVFVQARSRYMIMLSRFQGTYEEIAFWRIYKMGPTGALCVRCENRIPPGGYCWHSSHRTRRGRYERLCQNCIQELIAEATQ